MEGGRKRDKDRNLRTYTHTHTHSAVGFSFFQQNPWKGPMTAGAEAADKKKTSQIMRRLHIAPCHCVTYKPNFVLTQKKKTQQATQCWISWIKSTSHLVSLINTSSWLKNSMCLFPIWKGQYLKKGKVLVECSVCAASLNGHLFSGRQ